MSAEAGKEGPGRDVGRGRVAEKRRLGEKRETRSWCPGGLLKGFHLLQRPSREVLPEKPRAVQGWANGYLLGREEKRGRSGKSILWGHYPRDSTSQPRANASKRGRERISLVQVQEGLNEFSEGLGPIES